MRENEVQDTLAHAPVGQWITAFNAHDVAALLSLYTDDAELFDAGMKYRRRGQAQIKDWFEQRFRTMPTISYIPSGGVLLSVERAAVTWTARGRGPRLLGQAWLSRPFEVDGVSVFTLHNGLIYQQRGYYDHLSVVEQILPPLKWLLLARF